tara:strand:+ start:195 stop:434 length:240 start_codon:yes stop_codon:yes gene_type:complete
MNKYLYLRKMRDVIKSCQTKEQFLIALKFAKLTAIAICDEKTTLYNLYTACCCHTTLMFRPIPKDATLDPDYLMSVLWP